MKVFPVVLVLWISLLFGWWVVKGYQIPPNLVAGPYDTYSNCLTVAQDLNRIRLTYEYRCEYH